MGIFQCRNGNGQISPHCLLCRTGGGVRTAGSVHCDHRSSAVVDGSEYRIKGRSRRTVKSNAKHAIHHKGGMHRFIGKRAHIHAVLHRCVIVCQRFRQSRRLIGQHNIGGHIGSTQPPGNHKAVPGIFTVAANHRHRLPFHLVAVQSQHFICTRQACPLHQLCLGKQAVKSPIFHRADLISC